MFNTSYQPSMDAIKESKFEELKQWELRLMIKEKEMNNIKTKNVTFIQSLQKQIDSLQKQLNLERNMTQKHKLKLDEAQKANNS